MGIMIKKPKGNPLLMAKGEPLHYSDCKKDTFGNVQQTLKANVAVGTVTKQFKDGSSTEEKETVKTTLLPEPHATVGLSIGVTRNLGNYESVKLTVSLFMPCTLDPEDIDATYMEVKGWVDTRVEHINEEISQDLAK